MKCFIIFLILVAFVGIQLMPSFATTENFYSFDTQTNHISNISSLDYNTLKKNTITASISNGEVTKLDFDMKSHVTMHVSMQDDGLLYVNIPKNIMHLADHNCNSNAIILVDGEEALNVLDHILDDNPESQNALIYDKNVKTWAVEVPKDSKEVEIAFAFIIPYAAYSYAFGQRCLMMENGEFMKPLMQKNLGLELHQVLCKDNLLLTYKKESRPACVTDETFIALFERGWKTLLFIPNYLNTPNAGEVGYNIVGDADILRIGHDPSSGITEISIKTREKSNLIMGLERDFTGIKFQEDRLDYSILMDGKEVMFEEPWGKNDYRINFQLNIPANTEKIEIIPTTSK